MQVYETMLRGSVMDKKRERKNKKPEWWRIVIFIIAIVYIVAMWVSKDVGSIYSSLVPEDIVPVIVTSVLVTLLKIGAMAGCILLIDWVIKKIKNRKNKKG